MTAQTSGKSTPAPEVIIVADDADEVSCDGGDGALGHPVVVQPESTISAEATNIDEYVPKVMPMRRARVKFLIDAPPNMKIASKVMSTVKEVLIERAIVSLRLRFTVSSNFSPPERKRFSRVRS